MNHLFVFDDYAAAADKLSFHYHYEDDAGAVLGSFTEYYELPLAIDVSDGLTAAILQHLHVIIGISYYKSLLGEVQLPYSLSQPEADYYNEIFDKGLGEYRFINQITGMIRPFTASSAPAPTPVALQASGAVLGIGGGKDSIVAGEILKAIGLPTTTIDIATRDNHGQAGAVMDIMGLPQLRIGRYVDTTISTFTDQNGGKHGHVPLSVILAWLGVLVAAASGARFVVMANEAGTSTGNTVWDGREINHQWAKSYEQEQLTQSFIKDFISPDIVYFSPIRPYSSLAIMDLMSKLGTAYLEDFTSCNLVLRIDPATRPNGRWCTHCAKCLSSWLLLSSWLSTENLVAIFGRNLWTETTLRPTLLALLGLEGHKPLDCVGTTEELRAVTRKAIDEQQVPLLADISAESIPGPSIGELVSSRAEANIPPELQGTIEAYVTKILQT